MASVITYILFALVGAMLLGPVGFVAGVVVACIVNRRAEIIEAQWEDARARALNEDSAGHGS